LPSPIREQKGGTLKTLLSREHLELRDGFRRFLAATSPIAEVRRLLETPLGYAPEVWARMVGELGLPGLAIPERYGGLGFGPAEQVIVGEEMGRSLLCSPYFSSAVLAASALLSADDEAMRTELLPAIADGSRIVTLAVPEQDGVWRADHARTRAVPVAGGFVLTGHKPYVPDGHIADTLLVTAHADGGPSLFAVDAGAPGLARRAAPAVDPTRRQVAVDLDEVPGRPVGAIGTAVEVIEQMVWRALPALASEQAGGAQRCLDMSVEYAKLRRQFGQPIGDFQAIRHKWADMRIEVESARWSVYYAALSAVRDPGRLPLTASLAKICCSEAFCQVAAENIQIHGATGFAGEHEAQLHYQRARSAELLLGSPSWYRQVAAACLTGTRGRFTSW
jgi:alkylation response protein AidB-like acyl-CoA dehydrogenase